VSFLEAQLCQYAAYHRNRSNIITHFIGVPIIVWSVVALLSRLEFAVGSFNLNAAMLAALAAGVFYLWADLRFGAVLCAFLLCCVITCEPLSATSLWVWLSVSLAAFVVGWAVQFVGHYFEGRKPAFFDDLLGLLIGPLFVVAELGFWLGWRKDLDFTIQSKVGPVVATT
jgi:uncharacterized membrane protein YGL010W